MFIMAKSLYLLIRIFIYMYTQKNYNPEWAIMFRTAVLKFQQSDHHL